MYGFFFIFQVILLIQPYKNFRTTSLPPPLPSKKQWSERERGTEQTRPPARAILPNAEMGETTKIATDKRGAHRTTKTTQSSAVGGGCHLCCSAAGNTGGERPRGHSLLSHSLKGYMLHLGRRKSSAVYLCLLFTR